MTFELPFREIMNHLYGANFYKQRKPLKYDFVILLEILTALRELPRTTNSISERIRRSITPGLHRHLILCEHLGFVRQKGKHFTITEKGNSLLATVRPASIEAGPQLTKEYVGSLPSFMHRKKLPFIKFKACEGKGKFFYLVRFTSELRLIPTPYDQRPAVDLELVRSNDADYKKGSYSVAPYQRVLYAKLKDLSPLTGKLCKIINLGRPQKKSWYDYTIELVQGN